MCVCVCVCVSVHTHTHTHTYIYIYIYILDMKQLNVRQCSCQDKTLKERPGPRVIMQKLSFIRNKLRTKTQGFAHIIEVCICMYVCIYIQGVPGGM